MYTQMQVVENYCQKGIKIHHVHVLLQNAVLKFIDGKLHQGAA